MTCRFCKKSFRKEEAVGFNGRYIHADCFDQALAAAFAPLKKAVKALLKEPPHATT